MEGKTVLITGGTNGIGRATALGLAALGARVIITGRDRERAAGVVAANPDRISYLPVDFASLASVRELAAEVIANEPRLDVLINNAGGIFQKRTTADGYDHTFQVNHLAAFVLTNALMPLLKASAPARVITVSSAAERMGSIDFADLQNLRRYRNMTAYGRSKRANILFSDELARRLAGTGVTSNAVHPGGVATGFGESGGTLMRYGVKLARPFMMSAEKSARQLTWLASAPELAETTGQFFSGGKPTRGSAQSRDRAVAARLWEESERLAGLAV